MKAAIFAVIATAVIASLTAATPLISQLILKSDLMVGKKIDNAALFTEGCQDLTNAVVKILNSTKDS